MLAWLRRIQEWATRDRITRLVDPILGELIINESSWECCVDTPSGPIMLSVGGRFEPDPALLATARQTFNNMDAFVADVKTFLNGEAEKPEWKQFANEIKAQRIHDVNYWWPKRPHAGMIFFEGPDECKLWHCDIEEQRIYGLAVDS